MRASRRKVNGGLRQVADVPASFDEDEPLEVSRAYTNPRLVVLKLLMAGSTVGKSAALTPNHCARVAAYCELAVLGTQRPFEPESSGPPSAKGGIGAVNLPAVDRAADHDVVRAPGMVAAVVGVGLEGPAEVRHGERGHFAGHIQLHGRVVKRGEGRGDLRQQRSFAVRAGRRGCRSCRCRRRRSGAARPSAARTWMICAICFNCEASPLFAGKTVCSGVMDCTASARVLA